MGLIRAAMGAAGGVMADQWKEYFYCEAMPADLLATRGWKRQSGRSANTKGSDNIISNGSIVAVADGQCAMIVEQGKVVDMCAEPGEYTYDTGSAPSLFSGDLSDSIGAVFQNIGKRFTFGGEAPMDQRIYYFNTKELVGNKYGTPQPGSLPRGRPARRHRHRHCHPLLWRVQLPHHQPHFVLHQCLRQRRGRLHPR